MFNLDISVYHGKILRFRWFDSSIISLIHLAIVIVFESSALLQLISCRWLSCLLFSHSISLFHLAINWQRRSPLSYTMMCYFSFPHSLFYHCHILELFLFRAVVINCVKCGKTFGHPWSSYWHNSLKYGLLSINYLLGKSYI